MGACPFRGVKELALTSIAPHRPSWSDWSLAQQFAVAGGIVMFLATIATGYFVSSRIEDVVVRNAGTATALYMEAFIAPLTQDLARQGSLSDASRAEIEWLISSTPLGDRVVSFKIWRKGGLVVEASNAAIVGMQFSPSDNLKLAWQGAVQADFDDTLDEESAAEQALGIPLLEIYSPIRETETGRVIAVAEFYENATQLRSDLTRARLTSWGAVAALMTVIGASLFAVVLGGSRTIDRQVLALTDMSQRNLALRLRVQGAASRFSALNDTVLRRIGADLHDGPAQLMGFVALRLDALRAHLTTDAARAEILSIERAVKDSIADVRTIARGLSMPDVDRRALPDLIQTLVDSHVERTGCAVQVTMGPGIGTDIPLAVKICVFRAVQEGLTNGWRHAEGRGQAVGLSRHGDLLRLVVQDRGPGLPANLNVSQLNPDDAESGMGLAGLTDRVESLGGHLELRNRPKSVDGGGAELYVEIDLKGAA